MKSLSISNPQHVAFLTENYLHKSNPEMAHELETTVGAVTGLLQRLNLRRPIRKSQVETLPGENWKPCVHHPGYRVSNLGRVANGDTLLIQTINGRGYMQVKMYDKSGERKSERVHRLVVEAFLPKPRFGQSQVNHIDGSKRNNAASNLEWVSGKENVQHAVANGLVRRRSGTEHPMCKYPESLIRQICLKLAAGETPPVIERELGIRRGYVSTIASKRIWKKVSDEYFR
jgi:hypothetical protein